MIERDEELDVAEPGLRILAEMLEEASERRRLRVVADEEGSE